MNYASRSGGNPLTTHSEAGIPANMFVKLFRDMPCTNWDEALAIINAIYLSPHTTHDRYTARGVVITKDARGNISLQRTSAEEEDGDWIDVILYDTPIVRYYQDGSFSVDNGGFNTPTTSTRISQFTPHGYHAYHANKKLCLAGSGIVVGDVNHNHRVIPGQRSTSGVGWPE